MNQYSVLIVEDDEKLAVLIETYFKSDGFITSVTHDGNSALKLAKELRPDIIVLDLMLPGLDGLEVCLRIRKDSDVPVIMLTARDDEMDRLAGLQIGADDYVTKPFSPREVVARARAILRRTYKQTSAKQIFKVADLLIDISRHEVRKGGDIIDLTPTEFKILELFANNSGRVLNRLQIVEKIQDYAFEGYERTIDAHVKNLRRKIEDNPKEPRLIQTVYGVGYKFMGGEVVE
ncbi:response regulator transcription factor [Dendrosporobacter sp. 1207_IL3150]|uniref:response regulator transcription factor n=1 Tax=Dendrosporobacter sp. 1207_IL3150 TaxID=3084054 RepID=UPI002FD8BFAC